MESRGYNLLSVADYGKVIEKVGFENVEAIDKTDQFIDVLKNELKKFDDIKEDFIKVQLNSLNFGRAFSTKGKKNKRQKKTRKKQDLFSFFLSAFFLFFFSCCKKTIPPVLIINQII